MIVSRFKCFITLCFVIFVFGCTSPFSAIAKDADTQNYLFNVKQELLKKWPNNKTINIVFHGHSVPSGYFKTPHVNTLWAYPYLLLKKLKAFYPYAVINIITTGVGGENSVKGITRFNDEVLNHKPDVLFIDYALNDRRVGLHKAKIAWENMIKKALKKDVPVILLTPSPDTRVNYNNPQNELQQHTNQIRLLAKKYNIGLVDSYKAFQHLYTNKDMLKAFMAQVNHPNKKGHELIVNEIVKYFK